MRHLRLIILTGALTALALMSSGCAKLQARDNLNKGAAAFRGAKYQEAAEFFKKAIELDPTFSTARIYLRLRTCSSTFRVPTLRITSGTRKRRSRNSARC